MRRAEQQTERVLPQNEVAEISVLGAILQNAQAVAEAIEVLQPEDSSRRSIRTSSRPVSTCSTRTARWTS